MKEATYLAIAGRIRAEMQDLSRVAERVMAVWHKATVSADDYYVDAVALNLHSFYAGLEHLFEVIADGIDQTKPGGTSWHQELLRQMSTEIATIRPPVLTSAARNRLERYRGFRHVVRNVYTFNLDPEQIALLVKELQPTLQQTEHEMLAFANLLEEMVTGE